MKNKNSYRLQTSKGMYSSTLSDKETQQFRKDSTTSQIFYSFGMADLNYMIDKVIEIMARDNFRISDAFSKEKGYTYYKK